MKYSKPQDAPNLPQGAWKFTPAVKAFGPHDNPQDLQADINAWFLTAVLLPEIRWSITETNFSSAQFANNVIHYSALITYLIITVD